MMNRILVVTAAIAVCCGAVLRAEEPVPAPAGEVYFETSVRPILKAHCWHCHGEEGELKGSLDTRLARLLLAGGDTGPSVVSGKHAESPLYERVAAGEMPPGKKKLSAAEMEVLARWIDGGAKTLRPEPEQLAEGDVFTEEERSHWSFQPVVRHEPPTVKGTDRVRTEIDRFLLRKLEEKNLGFGPDADKVTLIRRLSFDLTGLPPKPEETEAFLADESPEAYERVVDRLLMSPAYGERWARHWLDVAGYADSDGFNEKDTERKWAYRYRDYVIRSLNDDKPWNEFLVEQLAGDELLTPPYANLTSEQADKLIATGFLRMGPDGTLTENPDPEAARNEVMVETVKIVSTSILGLTVGCAQCHLHRFDPITQSDYFRMRALFEPAYDWKNWRNPNQRLISLWTDETQKRVAEVDEEVKGLEKKKSEELDVLVQQTFDQELAKLPAEIQPKAKEARETVADKRTPEQQELIKQYPFLNVDRGSVYLYIPDRLIPFNKQWDETIEAAKKKRPAEDLVMCLTEVPGVIPATFLQTRGDFRQPKQEVGPGELAVLNSHSLVIPSDAGDVPTSGRRLAYARNLTDGKHPLVGRVLVNRFWLHFFGKGLVATPGDFGAMGEKPSHPELLDWLADEFVQGGWRLKRLQRMIVLSSAYRQSSQRRDELESVDPENRLLGRQSVRRLEAEIIRDAVLTASGKLNLTLFGPPVPIMPDDVGQVVVGVDTRDGAGRPTDKFVALNGNEYRRSLYVTVKRSMPLGMLEPFDVPLMAPNCEVRNSSTVTPQSLLMMNSNFVVEQSKLMSERIRSEVGEDLTGQFVRAWELAFARKPTAEETAGGVAFLTEQAEAMAKPAAVAEGVGAEGVAAEGTAGEGSLPDPAAAKGTALAHLCQALLSSNAFLYVD